MISISYHVKYITIGIALDEIELKVLRKIVIEFICTNIYLFCALRIIKLLKTTFKSKVNVALLIVTYKNH